MKEYTDEEKEEIGRKIAMMLQMHKTTGNRYKTLWGTKTGIGVFNTLLRLHEKIETGDITQVI
jgi:hypothetical protein